MVATVCCGCVVRWWCGGFASVVVVVVIPETIMLMIIGVWFVVTVMVAAVGRWDGTRGFCDR